jgi:glutamate/tyrosine decarboxylase-like PLP-dependent enzyme
MRKEKYFTEKGVSSEELAGMLDEHKAGDAQWNTGRTFGFVFHPGDRHAEASENYRTAFQYESTLNPTAFPSLKKFEKEVVGMAAELMHGNKHVSGSVTTGGTESIFMALNVARERARELSGDQVQFEVVLPETAHPAFLKACHYLSLKPVVVPAGKDGRADPVAMEKKITPRTILLVASAPCFPYGVVDPVKELGRIASRHRLLLHVDACMGGFMLPFLEDLEYPVPEFDFRVTGVTSISLDAHKYGYAPKGTSIVLYRKRELRKLQFFIYTEWPGGIFASTTFMGTKSGGPVAGCWAIMNHLGREGYRAIAREVMQTTRRISTGINAFTSLEVIGDPHMSLLAFTSKKGNIFNIGDALQRRGWYLDRLQFPDALHLTITQLNIGMEEKFLQDLAEVLGEERELIKEHKATRTAVHTADALTRILPSSLVSRLSRWAGSRMNRSRSDSGIPQAALYGISTSFKNRRNIKELISNLLDGMY